MPKQLQMFLFCYATAMLNISKISKIQMVTPKKIYSRLVIAQQASQKNRNGKIDNGFFLQCFLRVH
jgi:hypothetical protein